LEKTFSCLTCRHEIKLQRKDDNSGWLKFNLNGTPHEHENKKQQPQTVTAPSTTPTTPSTAADITKLEAKMDAMMAEIKILRMAVDELKRGK